MQDKPRNSGTLLYFRINTDLEHGKQRDSNRKTMTVQGTQETQGLKYEELNKAQVDREER